MESRWSEAVVSLMVVIGGCKRRRRVSVWKTNWRYRGRWWVLRQNSGELGHTIFVYLSSFSGY
ncbi:hypothetical protein Hdeb2414_s0023g00627871 [Helianthus debilis subsp. tardiflorus]